METQWYRMDTKDHRKRNLAEAAKILRGGGILGIPTETVYGLGANALNEKAVGKIFTAKGRPQDNPLLIHVLGDSWLERYCEDIPEEAYKLTRSFWPGPLTLILKRKNCIPDKTAAGLSTVGVRCPDNEITRMLLRVTNFPIAAPSANRSGRPSCVTAEEVLEDMDGKIEEMQDRRRINDSGYD